MNNIRSAFKSKSAVVAYITCGDPDLETTAAAVQAAVAGGADLIELGIPFSDPTAEGVALQNSALRALRGGITTDSIFRFAGMLCRDITVPVVFVTYANVVFSYGTARFLAACRDAGISGLLLRDLPFEEKGEFHSVCCQYGVELISQIAPSSPERAAMIAREAAGFLYIVSTPEAESGLPELVRIIRENTNIPCAAQSAALSTDGRILEQELVALLEKYGKNAPGYIGAYLKKVKIGSKRIAISVPPCKKRSAPAI